MLRKSDGNVSSPSASKRKSKRSLPRSPSKLFSSLSKSFKGLRRKSPRRKIRKRTALLDDENLQWYEITSVAGIAWRSDGKINSKIENVMGPGFGDFVATDEERLDPSTGVRMIRIVGECEDEQQPQRWIPKTTQYGLPLVRVVSSKRVLSSQRTGRGSDLSSYLFGNKGNENGNKSMVRMNECRNECTMPLSEFTVACEFFDRSQKRHIELQLQMEDKRTELSNLRQLAALLQMQRYGVEQRPFHKAIKTEVQKRLKKSETWNDRMNQAEKNSTKHEQARFDWNACELGPPPFAPPRPSSDEVTKQVTELETQNQDQDEDEDDEEKEALNQMTDDISEMISIRTRFEIFSNALRAMCGVSGFIKYEPELLEKLNSEFRCNYFPRETIIWCGKKFKKDVNEFERNIRDALMHYKVSEEILEEAVRYVPVVASRDVLMEFCSKTVSMMQSSPLEVSLLNRVEASPISLEVVPTPGSAKSNDIAILRSMTSETFRLVRGIPGIENRDRRSSWIARCEVCSILIVSKKQLEKGPLLRRVVRVLQDSSADEVRVVERKKDFKLDLAVQITPEEEVKNLREQCSRLTAAMSALLEKNMQLQESHLALQEKMKRVLSSSSSSSL